MGKSIISPLMYLTKILVTYVTGEINDSTVEIRRNSSNVDIRISIKGPFGLFLFHWNKVCTSENPQKSEKKSERAPWPWNVPLEQFFFTKILFFAIPRNLGPQFCYGAFSSITKVICYCKREISRFLFQQNVPVEQKVRTGTYHFYISYIFYYYIIIITYYYYLFY